MVAKNTEPNGASNCKRRVQVLFKVRLRNLLDVGFECVCVQLKCFLLHLAVDICVEDLFAPNQMDILDVLAMGNLRGKLYRCYTMSASCLSGKQNQN